MEDINNIRKYIQRQEYAKCNKILENLIIQKIIEKIKAELPSFEYITMADLIEASNICLEEELVDITKQIRIYSFDIDEDINTYRLLNLYKRLENLQLYS